ncbi:hypothetical protein ABZ490_14515 [Streptomyces sp. NPDC005811]|uniref:hypothetical protein n=1 Tax=Streptomyces sp. NPDC005811 TaxID=3154565 RepID=UPI0033E97FC7
MGIGVGVLLIFFLRWYEHWAYARSDAWVVCGALCGGGLVGAAAWVATGADNSAVGWAVGAVFVVHLVAGTILAGQEVLHDRGREVTVTVLTEHVHRDVNDIGVQTGISYAYDVAAPAGLPHRRLDAMGTRLAVGQRVRATVDPQGRVDSQLGGRPGPAHVMPRLLRVCELLLIVLSAGVGAFFSVLVAAHRSQG